MALRLHLFFSNALLQQPHQFLPHPIPTTAPFTHKPKTHIPCNKRMNKADLASDLATEVAKMNTHLLQREEAMDKSKQLLFSELCQFLGMKEEEMKRKWRKMDEEQKSVLVKGFVSDWSVDFHPLSARSVKELLEEFLHEENPSQDSSASELFPGLKRIMGLKEEK